VRLLLALALAAPLPAAALSGAAKEFIEIAGKLEPVHCEKRRLRRQMALALAEQRDADLRELRARVEALNRSPETARLERRLAELEKRVSGSSDPEDLPAVSLQQREAFYRCE
jgi:hypothetical protein